jgi:hypothetical protein
MSYRSQVKLTSCQGFVVGFSCLEIALVARGVGSHMEDVPKETLSQMFFVGSRVQHLGIKLKILTQLAIVVSYR